MIVYTARKIHTMNPSFPEGTAVAVKDGRIIEVGTLESLKPWLESHPYKVDDRFRNHILMPGFIDPHFHPATGGILLPTPWITAMDWNLPDKFSPAVKTHEGFIERLKEIEQGMNDPNEVLLTWGYHKIWHGKVYREQLNEISRTRPIFIWQRSYHEAIANDAALDWMETSREDMERHHQIDLETGRFYETGLSIFTRAISKIIFDPERFSHGLDLHKRMVHAGGHTTVCDMAYPMLDHSVEWDNFVEKLDTDDVPFRTKFVPRGALRGDWNGDPAENLKRINEMETKGTHRLKFGNAVKLFADGGFNAELMQLQAPGYIDGHHGEWMVAPEYFKALAEQYWKAGKQIHVHCTGDLGLELALDTVEALLNEHPRFNHRFTIEHFGLSTPEQARRIKDLGIIVSAAVYYMHELGEAYWQHSIGYERASQMSRVGTLERLGVMTALHSDFIVAPPRPLNNVWVATNRFAESGKVLGASERTSLDFAMRAITINAAYVLNMENEIGSIRAGKLADFTVLEADPWEVPLEEIRDIPIWGTVFEGRPFPFIQ